MLKTKRLCQSLAASLILVMACVVWPVATAAANPKSVELEQKVADIDLLIQQLKDRMVQAQSIRDALAAQQKSLISEITLLTKSLKIEDYRQAGEHLRLRYNLELLTTVFAYLDALDSKLLLFQTGRERLSYLHRIAEDDLKMIATLNDLKIDALTTQISLVINLYLPEAHTIRIDASQLPLPSLRQVWNRVVKSS